MGKPVIKGTCITVEIILQRLGAGERVKDILQAHPHITKEGIKAALRTNRQKKNYRLLHKIDGERKF
ncbi:MAG: DUF433 domain-containing protein [Spirosomataceae bacterium]